MNAREIALDVLLSVIKDEAYSNVALSKALKEADLCPQDAGLVAEIVYGTLNRYRLLQYKLNPHYQGRVKEWIKVLLAMALYQIVYLDRVPMYAAVDEATKIATARGGEFNGKVVNAILRKLTEIPIKDSIEMAKGANRLAIETSHPTWLIRLWEAQFGEELTIAMARRNRERVSLVLRTNLKKTTTAELKGKLQMEDVFCSLGHIYQDALIVMSGNPINTNSFKEGLFYIQDEASMLPALALAPEKGAKVLDVCAAPGGKTLHLAEMVGDTGVVYAHDIYDHKINRIRENMARLDITNVEASLCSALELHTRYEEESFDYVLVDAPCSGLGILRRHPEARLTKQPEDLDAIVDIQKKILLNASKFVKPGGRLVYSTCTVNRKENQRQIEAFLNENQHFDFDRSFESRMPKVLEGSFEHEMLQLFPQDFDTDGFFIAALVRAK